MAENSFLCSTYSAQAGEPLPGTAPQGQVWFLLEYNGTWESKAFEASLIAEQVKDWVLAALAQIPGSKLLLIRTGSSGRAAGLHRVAPHPFDEGQSLTFYAAIAHETYPILYRFRLYSYEDLLDIDLRGLSKALSIYDARKTEEKLYLVCTHGRRDRCCARAGTLIYEAICSKSAREGAAESIWQCSHVGGHRFAANLVCFPHGIFYGRVDLEDVDGILSSYGRGHYYPKKGRGRSCFPGPAQAGEVYLRQYTNLTDLNAFGPVQTTRLDEALWKVRFQIQAEQKHYELLIAKRNTGKTIYPSCSSPEEEPLELFELLDLQKTDQ